MKQTKIIREPVEKPAAAPAPGSRVFRVRVRTIFGDATLSVPAKDAAAARARVVEDFAAGVTVED